MTLPDFDDVLAAHRRVAGIAVETPVLRAEPLDAATGAACYVKMESLQRTGSFKIRGAYNRLSQLDGEARKAGVVAFSSGNHGQGVACAARLLGMPAVIVMPADAPRLKIAHTRAHGAEVVLYDRAGQSREALAAGLAKERGATLVPSFNDPHIIAGQGTVGLELVRYQEATGVQFEAAIFPVGGGGLVGGSAIALHAHDPSIALWGVEPQGYDDAARSLAAGCILANDGYPPTLCDALQSDRVGPLTFALMQHHLAGMVTVGDDEVRRAVRFLFETFKVVVEPGGAAPFAALLAGKLDLAGRSVAIVCSGGNVDAERYGAIIAD
ncbi:MAG: threonine ammonia-lyase [Pseudomonadota bacterium]